MSFHKVFTSTWVLLFQVINALKILHACDLRFDCNSVFIFFRCKDWCRLPVITPCRHLLCLDCVALDSEKCTYPGCGNPYVMQSPEILTRPENPNPKWPVPKDLIELQPSYEQVCKKSPFRLSHSASCYILLRCTRINLSSFLQDDWDPDWQSTKSSKVAYLVERLKDLQELNWKVHQVESVNSKEILQDAQKRNYFACQENKTTLNGMSYKTLPEKVIVFSQFLEHVHVIEQQVTIS